MNHLPEHKKGIIAVLAAALLWSTGGVAIKLVTLSAMQISFFRGIFAALIFGIFFRKTVYKANLFTFVNSLFYAAILIFFVMATKTTTARSW